MSSDPNLPRESGAAPLVAARGLTTPGLIALAVGAVGVVLLLLSYFVDWLTATITVEVDAAGIHTDESESGGLGDVEGSELLVPLYYVTTIALIVAAAGVFLTAARVAWLRLAGLVLTGIALVVTVVLVVDEYGHINDLFDSSGAAERAEAGGGTAELSITPGIGVYLAFLGILLVGVSVLLCARSTRGRRL